MQDTLNVRFRQPLPDYYARRIIVWRDEDGEFAETVNEIKLENARLLVMQPDHMFELRRQIEVDYARENLLLYCPLRFDTPQENWLLDVFLYSEEFRADYWSLLFDELNIENTQAMREYAHTVNTFFASKERRMRLKALCSAYSEVEALQIGIFCVLCGLKAYDMQAVTRTVLASDAENSPLDTLAKFCGEDAFWQVMKREYGYEGKHSTTLLTCHILNSAAMVYAGDEALPGLNGSAKHSQNAYSLFSSWMREDSAGLMEICRQAEQTSNIPARLSELNRTVLTGLGIYPAVDQLLLSSLLKGFAAGIYNTDDAEKLLQARADKPWHGAFAAYYAVIQAMNDVQLFYQAHRESLRFADAETAWRSYSNDLYRMDQGYRAFCNAYEAALGSGVMALEDDLKAAHAAVERLYKNWFLAGLNEAWINQIEKEPLEKALPRQIHQTQFYSRCVSGAESRVFVIISDGLRYETARELTERLNGKLNGNAVCLSMVAALPTVTPVGMAALLPHRKLRMEDDLHVRCDGFSTDVPDREIVLKAWKRDSAAVRFDAFRQMNRSQRQELVRGSKIIYIYHDAIDACGESGGKVPAACETAMNDLIQIMRILVNELSASTILITADHGFLYTQSPLDEYEKTDRDVVEGEVLEYKRRHAIVKAPRHDPRAVYLPLTAVGREDLTGVFPRGCMRFRLQGGGNSYMHGGLSLQELMVPLIQYQNKKTGQKGFTAIKKTDVILLGDQRRISNNIFTLAFFQKEPCVGKVLPRRITARFEDSSGLMISDEHRIDAASTAPENNDRVTRVTFRLLGSGYDRTADYWLVLTDREEERELERIPFTIDVVFGLDFAF